MNFNSSSPIFQNAYFLAWDKPANCLTTPSRIGRQDPRPCLGLWLQENLGLQIFPVHRLDFEVSGLVLFALSTPAQAAANGWFEHRLVRKTYHAITTGDLPAGPFPICWENKLVRGKKRSFAAPHGQWAKTEAWAVPPSHNQEIYWRLRPLTGRPHQLRVHLASSGHPIWGDQLYGCPQAFQEGIALRAVELDFSSCPGRADFSLPERINVPGLF